MGGDGQLQHCDYAAEFIEFLKELEKEGPNTEFLIVGDTFGFWELTLVRGIERLAHIIQAHQAIFDQLRATGARIKVTMMVGNHDYDLACDPAFVEKLQAYNIHLDPSLVLIRPVGARGYASNTDSSAISSTASPNMATLALSRWATSSRKPSSTEPAGIRTSAGETGSRTSAPWARCRFPTGCCRTTSTAR